MNKCGTQDEHGNSMLNLLFFFIFIAVLVTMILRIMPVYYNNMNLQHILNTQTRAVHPNESVARVGYRLGQRLNVQMLTIPSTDIAIRKTATGVSIRVKYSKVIPLIYHASLLIRFNNFSETP